MRLLLAIALGGALGSVGRYWFGAQIGQWLGMAFPWGTLAVNSLGGFAMGVVVGALGPSGSTDLRAFLMVGVLGGFTTFSAFALDVVTLVERGAGVLAAAYVGASVAFAVLGLMLGLAAVRWIAG
jgi:fluoride exporter